MGRFERVSFEVERMRRYEERDSGRASEAVDIVGRV